MTLRNRPFPSFPKPLSQSEANWEARDIEIILYSRANKSHFTSVHKKRFCIYPRFESETFFCNSEIAFMIY